MPRLVLSNGKEFPIQGRELVLGREADCDIVLEDSGISRRHARIVWEGGRHVLYELQSRNGTFVKGRKVERAELQEGDEILLGKATLRLLPEALAAGPEEILLEAAESGPPASPLRRPASPPRKVVEATLLPAAPPRVKQGSLLQADVLQYGGLYRFLIFLGVVGLCAGVFFGSRYLAGRWAAAKKAAAEDSQR